MVFLNTTRFLLLSFEYSNNIPFREVRNIQLLVWIRFKRIGGVRSKLSLALRPDLTKTEEIVPVRVPSMDLVNQFNDNSLSS